MVSASKAVLTKLFGVSRTHLKGAMWPVRCSRSSPGTRRPRETTRTRSPHTLGETY